MENKYIDGHIDLDINLIEKMSELFYSCSRVNCLLKLKNGTILKYPVSKYGININGVNLYGILSIDFGNIFLRVAEKNNDKEN